MRVWLDTAIDKALQNVVNDREVSLPPQLSCEGHGLEPHQAVEILRSAIDSWQQELVLGFFRTGTGRREQVRACLFDTSELSGIIEAALESEEVVSIVDITMLGGCAFDLSPEEAPNPHGTVELLLTAWGSHEPMVKKLAEELNVSTFRQAKVPRLYR